MEYNLPFVRQYFDIAHSPRGQAGQVDVVERDERRCLDSGQKWTDAAAG